MFGFFSDFCRIKSSKKSLDFSDFCRFSGFFRFFSDFSVFFWIFFWVYEDFINKKNDLNTELLNIFLQKLLDFFMIFGDFSDFCGFFFCYFSRIFWGSVRGFF
jgi:hypothetical protein